jgi:SAM-dependent methyltransferase
VSAVDRESYDELYRSMPAVWSGRPNRQLVVEAGGLRPGTALDAGCGEGADALWLAERGWRVTAVDFSSLALDRGAARAADQGLDERIEWLHVDLDAWPPPRERFDLVTAHYLHARGADRSALFERLAAAVVPGGTLLVVGHLLEGGTDHDHLAHDPDLFHTAEDVAAVLDPGKWRDVRTEARERDRQAVERTGNPAPDTVLVARRRSGAGQAQLGQRHRDGVLVQEVQHEQAVHEHPPAGQPQVGRAQPGERRPRPGDGDRRSQ